MQALTKDPKWVTRTNGLLGATSTFFQDNVMAEKCEQAGTCNVDQLSFKAYLSRWLAATSVVLPSTAGAITPFLQASANGAVASCAGGPRSSTCGTRWSINNWDGTHGVGQQLAALEVVHGLLAGPSPVSRRVKARCRAGVPGLKIEYGVFSVSAFVLAPFGLYSILSSVQRCIARRFLRISDERTGMTRGLVVFTPCTLWLYVFCPSDRHQ